MVTEFTVVNHSPGLGVAFKCPAVQSLRPERPSLALEALLRPHLCWWPADVDEELLPSSLPSLSLGRRVGTLEMALGQLVGESDPRTNLCAEQLRRWSDSPYLQHPACETRPAMLPSMTNRTRRGTWPEQCPDDGSGTGPLPLVRDLDLHVSLHFRLAFIRVYKAGSRSWFEYLRRLGPLVETTLHATLANASLPKLLYFAFVREPAARFFSGYEEVAFIQYKFPLDAARGRCPERTAGWPNRGYPVGVGKRTCGQHAKQLRRTLYGRIPLTQDGQPMARRFQAYIRHQARSSGIGIPMAEDHTWSQTSFLLGSVPESGRPWVPDFVGRLEHIVEDADELIGLATARLPSALGRRLGRLHASFRSMLDPRRRASPSFTSRSSPIHRPPEFYFSAVAAIRSVCEDFCKLILQDTVCFGYQLPQVCAGCREGADDGPATWESGHEWQREYRSENCRFFQQTQAWGGSLQEEWWCRGDAAQT